MVISKVKRRVIILVIVLGLFIFNNVCFGQFTVTTEIRPRLELRNGYSRLPKQKDLAATFVSQRSRININYKNSSFITTLGFQDVRVWGDDSIYKSTGMHGNEASIDLYQANFEWIISKRSQLCIGRQGLEYDDKRLISRRNWNQKAMAYDALLFKIHHERWDVHLGISLNNNRENKYGNLYDQDKMKTLNYLHIQRSLRDLGHFSILAAGSGFTASDSSEVIYMRATTGGYLVLKLLPFNYALSLYYQFGKNRFGTPVQAYFMSSKLDWRYRLVELSAGIDYLSGNGPNNSVSKDRLFSLLYGSRHRFYGTLDYFSDMSKGTHSRGLVDLWLRASSDIAFNCNIRADFHFFSVQDNQIISHKTLGYELDIKFSQKFTPELLLSGGFSIFNSSEYFRTMQASNDSNHIPIWAWIMLDFKIDLFKNE